MFYSNSITITGPDADLNALMEHLHVNCQMIDVDDGAGHPFTFDEAANYANHREFVDFMANQQKVVIKRIRLNRIDSGVKIQFDSHGGHAGAVTHWMAKTFPSLQFETTFFDDCREENTVAFGDGTWHAWKKCRDGRAEQIEILGSGKYGH